MHAKGAGCAAAAAAASAAAQALPCARAFLPQALSALDAAARGGGAAPERLRDVWARGGAAWAAAAAKAARGDGGTVLLVADALTLAAVLCNALVRRLWAAAAAAASERIALCARGRAHAPRAAPRRSACRPRCWGASASMPAASACCSPAAAAPTRPRQPLRSMPQPTCAPLRCRRQHGRGRRAGPHWTGTPRRTAPGEAARPARRRAGGESGWRGIMRPWTARRCSGAAARAAGRARRGAPAAARRAARVVRRAARRAAPATRREATGSAPVCPSWQAGRVHCRAPAPRRAAPPPAPWRPTRTSSTSGAASRASRATTAARA